MNSPASQPGGVQPGGFGAAGVALAPSLHLGGPGGSASPAPPLGALPDVNLVGNGAGKFLYYNGTLWVPLKPALGNASGASNLSDVNVSGVADKTVLVYDQASGTWKVSGGAFAGPVTSTVSVQTGAGSPFYGPVLAAKTALNAGTQTWTIFGGAQNVTVLYFTAYQTGNNANRSWWRVTVSAKTAGTPTLEVVRLLDGSTGAYQTNANPFTISLSGSDLTLTYTNNAASNTVSHDCRVSVGHATAGVSVA